MLKDHKSNCIQEAAIRETFQRLLEENSYDLADSIDQTMPFKYAETMADMMGSCLAFNLHDEAKAIANQIITDSKRLDFDSRRIINLVQQIKTRLQTHSNIDIQDYSILFTVLLKKFISQAYKEKPIKPSGWSMKPRGCGCKDCIGLDSFITNSTIQSMRFTMAQKRRYHLQSRVYAGAFTTETDTRGNPQSLIVKKISKNSEYEVDYRLWQSNCSSMRNMLAELRGPFMKKLLGHSYEDLIELRYLDTNRKLDDVVKTPPSADKMSAAVLRENSKPPSSTNVPQGTGVKRKAEDQLSKE